MRKTGYQMRRSGDPRTDDGTRRLAHRSPDARATAPPAPPKRPAAVHGSAKKIIGDKFSAKPKTRQSEFKITRVSIFSVRSTPRCREAVKSAARTLPTIISASDLQTRHFTGATEKPRIKPDPSCCNATDDNPAAKAFRPLLRRESTPPPPLVSHSYVEVVRK